MKDTTIAWATHTFNPWIGCTKISPGCDHCYAEVRSTRFHQGAWGKDAARHLTSTWSQPVKWNRDTPGARVFCASLCDIFEDRRDLDAPRARLWNLILRTPRLTWLLLTKRPKGFRTMLPASLLNCPAVWCGVSVESQDFLWRAEQLAEVPSTGPRFVSYEPALGPVDFTPVLPAISWVIIGGESGSQARPFDLQWARDTITQCRAAAVSPFVKQPGLRTVWDGQRVSMDMHAMQTWPQDLQVREVPRP